MRADGGMSSRRCDKESSNRFVMEAAPTTAGSSFVVGNMKYKQTLRVMGVAAWDDAQPLESVAEYVWAVVSFSEWSAAHSIASIGRCS